MLPLISLAEVLRQMEASDSKGQPIPFSITYQKYNKRTKQGGDLVSINNAVLTKTNKTYTKFINTSAKPLYTPQAKAPNHFANATRNIREVGTMDITKIHIYLIYIFNEQEVVMNIY